MAVACAAVFLFAAATAKATTLDWTGNTSTDWETNTNWSPNNVPTSSDSVYINVTGASAPVITNTEAAVALTIGNSSTGDLTIQGGGSLNSSGGTSVIYTGTVTVTDAGSSWTPGGLLVGGSGTATVNILNGATVNSSVTQIGFGGTGVITVDGTGSAFASDGGGLNTIYLGFTSAGILTVSNGGSASVNGGAGTITLAFSGGSTGTINIGAASGSAAIAPGTLNVSAIDFNGGSSSTLVFNHTSSNYTFSVPLSGTGTIEALSGTTILTGDASAFNGAIAVDGGGTLTLNLPSSIGDSSTSVSVGFNGAGTLNVQGGSTLISGNNQIGFNTGSNGTVTVDGAGSTWNDSSGGLGLGWFGSGTLTVSNGGTFSENSGTGGISVAIDSGGSGTINIGAASGNTAVAPGILNVSAINFGGGGAGLLVFNHTSSNYVFAIPITGSSLDTIEALSGTTVLTADDSGFTGNITVDTGGTLTLNLPSSIGGSGSAVIIGDNGAGTLNIQSGSTLVSGGNAFIGNNNGSNGTVTVDGAGSTWTHSGDLYVGNAGNGALTVGNGGSVSNVNGWIGDQSSSTGTVTVDGTGSTWSNSGNIYVGEIGTGTLTISNGGTVSANGGAGTITIADQSGSTGTLNIGAANGNVAVAPGTIDAATVAFGSGTGTLVFNHTSSNYTFAPDITGDGTIDVQSGTTILTGNDSGFSGSTSVSSGATLEVDNTLGGAISMSSGSTLQGDGTVGALTLVSGATIMPGKSHSGSTGTLTVNGNYTQNAGSTMALVLTPSGAGRLAVNGTATLGGTLSFTPGAGTYVAGTTYNILTAASVSGTYATVTNTAPSVAAFNITYNSNDVVLTVESSNSGGGSFAGVAGTRDQQNIAATLDRLSANNPGGDFGAVLTNLSGLSGGAQQQALDQLNGHIATELASAPGGDLRAAFDGIGSHLANGMAGDDMTLAGDFGPAGAVRIADADDAYWGPDRAMLSDWSVWMQGIGQSAFLGSTGDAPGMSSRLGGMTFGFEWQMSRDDRLGIAFGATDASISVADQNQSGTQKTYLTGFYGEHKWEQLVGDIAALFGYNQSTSKRYIAFLAEQAKGATDGYGAGLETGLGYPIELDEDGTILMPRAGISYTYAHENGWTETGAPGANLILSGSNQHLVQSSLGAKLQSKFLLPNEDGSFDILRPGLKLAWKHQVLNPAASVNQAFAGVASSSFTAVGANPGRDAANIGLDLSYTPAAAATLAIYIRYDSSISINEQIHAVIAGAKYSW